jgi:hypothetical protein
MPRWAPRSMKTFPLYTGSTAQSQSKALLDELSRNAGPRQSLRRKRLKSRKRQMTFPPSAAPAVFGRRLTPIAPPAGCRK